ncbi:MAG: hypothetical protein AAGC77_05890 [Pseudomonadota bacterium]
MEPIAFLDLEASGLGAWSWPIEVGWCFLDGEPETHLLRPAPQWSMGSWDQNAQALHKITIEDLQQRGESLESVCKRLNAVLQNARVYSDAPDWDGFWLYRLFEAGGVRQQFEVEDFGGFFTGIARRDIEGLIRTAQDVAPHTHRAGDDALHMREIFRLIGAFR